MNAQVFFDRMLYVGMSAFIATLAYNEITLTFQAFPTAWIYNNASISALLVVASLQVLLYGWFPAWKHSKYHVTFICIIMTLVGLTMSIFTWVWSRSMLIDGEASFENYLLYAVSLIFLAITGKIVANVAKREFY